jgi:hypothetical protein
LNRHDDVGAGICTVLRTVNAGEKDGAIAEEPWTWQRADEQEHEERQEQGELEPWSF